MLKKRPVPEITELVCHSDIALGCLHEHALLLQTQGIKQRGPAQYRTVVYRYTVIAPHTPSRIFLFNSQSLRSMSVIALIFMKIINASTRTTSTGRKRERIFIFVFQSFIRHFTAHHRAQNLKGIVTGGVIVWLIFTEKINVTIKVPSLYS
jgi:hypothetical protein